MNLKKILRVVWNVKMRNWTAYTFSLAIVLSEMIV